MITEEFFERLYRIKGHVGYYYKNLISGESLVFNHEDLFRAASIIKFPMMVVMEKFFNSGKIDPLETVSINETDKVGGCGALSLIPGEYPVSYRGICNNMIAISDNTATNKLLSVISLETFAAEFQELGLVKTRINRLLYDSDPKKKGVENYFALSEVCGLLEKLYKGEAVNPEVSKAAIDCLFKQQINHKIPSRIPGSVDIAHKTGEVNNTSHDIALIYAKTPFVLGFASNNVSVYEMEDAMRNISYEVFCRHN